MLLLEAMIFPILDPRSLIMQYLTKIRTFESSSSPNVCTYSMCMCALIISWLKCVCMYVCTPYFLALMQTDILYFDFGVAIDSGITYVLYMYMYFLYWPSNHAWYQCTCTSSVRHGEGGINEMTIMNYLRAIKTNSKKYKKLCMWGKSVDSRAVYYQIFGYLFLQESHRY